MKTSITSLLIGALLATTTACADEPFKHVSKESRDCDNVAKRIEYVKPAIKGFNEFFNVRFGPYTVLVPPGFNKVAGSMEEGSIFISYPNKKLIAVTSSYSYSRRMFKNMDIKQFPEILFMKTMCDDLPKTAAEQAFWEAAFIDKAHVFDGSDTAMTTTDKRLTYYLSNYKVGDFSGRAHIVDRLTKDTYLILEARGFDYKDFKNIALNVTTWN